MGLRFSVPWKWKQWTCALLKNRCGFLPNRSMAALVGRPSLNRLKFCRTAFGARDPFELQPARSFGHFNKGCYLSVVDIAERCAVTHAVIKRRGPGAPPDSPSTRRDWRRPPGSGREYQKNGVG